MRTSQYLISTTKETPGDAELPSHRLMLRAGMIRKLAAGVYSWLPMGLRVLQKVTDIVRQEMNRAGALEILMPLVQPQELWQQTGRWNDYGAELLRIKDRHERGFCLGPTHEEVVTDLLGHELSSYKQVPINVYQIATKFRDEIRPRFGVMRAREFIMKDAYSFDIDRAGLQVTYDTMYKAYCRIFERVGLDFRAVLADTGSIGGDASHEFQVLADSGEDVICYSDASDYAANIEQAEALPPTHERPEATITLSKVATPTQQSITEVSEFLQISPAQTLKTLIVHGVDTPLVALVLRGDHALNEIKAQKHPGIFNPLTLASEAEIQEALGCKPGFIGPVNCPLPVIVDRAAAVMSDFVCGANETGFHYQGVNWLRDLPLGTVTDLRNVVAGDPSPDGQGHLQLRRGIEVGHIFQLGTKYSHALGANVLNEQGKTVELQMGCYGIGVSRIVAAAIEQHHDENGIIWPEAIAPFQVVLVPIQLHKSELVQTWCDEIYSELQALGLEVLYDDRPLRPGVMFADMDLLGIPHRIVIGEKGIAEGMVEYKHRQDKDARMVKREDLAALLKG